MVPVEEEQGRYPNNSTDAYAHSQTNLAAKPFLDDEGVDVAAGVHVAEGFREVSGEGADALIGEGRVISADGPVESDLLQDPPLDETAVVDSLIENPPLVTD